MPSQPAYLQTWPLEQVLSAIGFNLDGWTVALAGDETGGGQVAIRLRYPLARPLGMPAAISGTADPAAESIPGGAADLVIHLGLQSAAEAAEAAAVLRPCCRWLALTLPAAPGHWEALDHLPIAHRFVFPDHDPVAAKWAAHDVKRQLSFGFLVRGGREPADLPLRPAHSLLLPATREPALRESGLRLLFVSDSSWARMLAGDYYDPDRIKVLHPRPATRCQQGCDAHFEPGRDSFARACEQLPPGWTPDAVVVVTPEYAGIPAGLEDCPWPTVALVSDWNVNIRNLAPCLGAFDLVLGDSSGMQRLRALGFERVHYWPMYSYDPALHRPSDAPETHDLAFIGNLNHRVQRQRTRWLRHVADMADACKVMIGVGLFGADYAQVLQASRLVFNRSIRGELNLRCYEAPACGALLLVEDTNDEARTLLRDGVDCAYYNETTLDDIVARFLGSAADRDRIAASGTARALESSYTAHFSGFLTLLRDLLAAPRRPRPFRTLPEAERLLRLGRLAYRRTDAGRLPFAQALLARARDLAPSSVAISADLAVVCASMADELAAVQGSEEAASLARELFDAALAAAPDHPVAGLNAAWFFRERDPDRTRALLQRVAETDSGPCTGLLYPMTFRHLEVEMETAWHMLIGRQTEQETELRRLLTWQAAQWLGDRASGHPEWPGIPQSDRDAAIHWYQVACGLRPDLAETQVKLGEALLENGEFQNAEARFRAALQDNSLSVAAMKGLIRALAGRGETRLATAFYDECLAILPAIPQLLDRLDELRNTYWSAMGSAPGTGAEGDRLTLEGLGDRSYLLFAEGPRDAWLPGLQAYVEQVRADEAACLVVYSSERPPDAVLDDIQNHLERSGLDPERIPDILVVDRPLSERQEHDLVTLVQGVYAALPPGRQTLVGTIGRPLLGDFLGAGH